MNLLNRPFYRIKITERKGVKYYQPVKYSDWFLRLVGCGHHIYHDKETLLDAGYLKPVFAAEAIEQDKTKTGYYDKVTYRRV